MSEEGQSDGGKKSASSISEASDAAHQDATTNVSQANLTQMTASSVSSPDTGKWNCELCTYENFPLSRKCTMCRTPKACLNEDIFRLQDGASALPPPEICEAESVAERLKPLRISSPGAGNQPGASAPTKWCCQTCTYENWPKSQKCAMCGASAAELTDISHATRTVDTIESHATETDSKTRRRNQQNHDWLWLHACIGVVEGNLARVQRYLSGGGSVSRALTPAEVALLARPSAFDAGHTLVHLAIRFQRQDILSTLLSRISGGAPGLKRSPSYVSPELGAALRRHVASCMRRSKGAFPATYLNDFSTFCIPAEVSGLEPAARELVLSELVDGEAAETLAPLLRVRLLALWNRSAGDCLPDAVCQAALGVCDRQNLLRIALADTLTRAHPMLYSRWAMWEEWQASLLQYSVEESQLRSEWSRLVAAATRPGTALHQIHVFVLAHVMRRPLLVYGVNLVHSFRGEPLGYAKFQGIYLPLLWDPEFCSKSPLCLGYTRGHFSALVPIASYSSRRTTYICREREEEDIEEEECTYLPLTDSEGKMLPVHFLTCDEMSESESLVQRYLDVSGREARNVLPPPHPLVQQLLHAWLQHYRIRTCEEPRGPFPPRLRPPAAAPAAPADFSSDPDTDDE